MIYFDNAATSFPKPVCVKKAVEEAILNAGNPGRGVHSAAVWSAKAISHARETVARLFNIDDISRIAFTLNATHALNIAVNFCKGEILTTSMEHNSVLRPCHARGFYRVIKADYMGRMNSSDIIRSISELTGAVIMTHASNVTGNIYDIEKVGSECKRRGILFIVDASQTAGVVPIDVKKMNIDVLCFAGHKGLYGLQGTGGIYVAPHVPTRPYMCGGTGNRSFDLVQPDEMPECFEAGTVNTHGVASLGAGAEYVMSVGVANILAHEQTLRKYFIEKACRIERIKIYGDLSGKAVGVVSIGHADFDPYEIGSFLASKDICVRAGIHCAPLAHRSIGSGEKGTVRFSFGYNNSKNEIDYAIDALKRLRR
ncbi:MAG: aminotransferase class V-fold PLP-dependent enzyme [Clostridia bacterium]|nr:aminotransferase class V-fold PLP-dependent enzyme [Clostridia bacterium]